ncbi:hypothetical protein [Streptomyces sp. T028]|uniref:hypothetical protein n=1 Tax=Streptomyces sp. T028 TaxID=3394379 RepID=UPI003A8572DF
MTVVVGAGDADRDVVAVRAPRTGHGEGPAAPVEGLGPPGEFGGDLRDHAVAAPDGVGQGGGDERFTGETVRRRQPRRRHLP